MARYLVRSLCFVAAAVAFILQGCGKSTPASPERESSPPTAARAAQEASPTSSSEQPRGRAASISPTVARVPREQQEADELPPWLAELLHAPDPNVRIQALDAWAREPTASLDPVTYALVDPDESVRMRAQEVFERALARR
jgi:hypothetical protein